MLGLSREVINRLVINDGLIRIGEGNERYLIIPIRAFGAMYEVTYRLVGHGVTGLLYLVGKEIGRRLLEEVRYRLKAKEIKTPEATAKELFSFLSDLGFGRVELVSLEDSKAVVRIYDSPTSSSVSKCERPVCHLERGILAGAAEAFFGVKCVANEVKCRCLGSNYCEFIVSWGKS